MNKLKRFKCPLLVLAMILFVIGSFFIGSKYALDHLTISQVSPTQVANAMKDDHFWASYREDTLLISGIVTSVTHSGNKTIVGFNTTSSYGAQCSFINTDSVINIGQSIRVLTIANAAERLTSGVQLNNCLRL